MAAAESTRRTADTQLAAPVRTSPTIRRLSSDELDAWYGCMLAQLEDNGRDGRYFTTLLPDNAAARFSAERLAEARLANERPVGEPGWTRVFGLWDGDRLVGHADLRGGAVASEKHRCTLGLGLLHAWRGRGHGRQLSEAALAFAAEAGVVWMDLGVFEGNEPAIALYQKLGFREVGRVHDRFRVQAASLTEILMTRRT